MNKHSDNFIEDIKHLLEKEPFFEPDERAIADMKNRLDLHDQVPQTKKVFWWWLLLIPLLTIPFLFSTLYLFQKSKGTQQELVALHQQLDLLNTSTDSSTQHLTTVYYDTVYQTVYKTEVIVQKTKSTPNYRSVYANEPSRLFSPAGTNFYNASFLNVASPPVYSNGFPSRWNLNSAVAIEKTELAESSQSGLAALQSELAPLAPLAITPLSESPEQIFEEWYPTEGYDSRINPLLYLVPTGINAGVQVMPALSFGIPGTVGLGLGYGVTGELCFHKNLRLGVGLNKLNLGYSTNQNFSAYPPVNPENPQDLINELYISLNYLEIPVHFRCLLSTSKKITPFINIGMLSRRTLNQTFDFELSGATNNEYQRRVIIPGNSFGITGFQGGLGVEYPIRNKINAKAQLLYKQDIKLPNMEYVKANYLGLDLSLFYQFK